MPTPHFKLKFEIMQVILKLCNFFFFKSGIKQNEINLTLNANSKLSKEIYYAKEHINQNYYLYNNCIKSSKICRCFENNKLTDRKYLKIFLKQK